MAHVTQNFSSRQRDALHKLGSVLDLYDACPQNFNGRSECWAAISFEAIAPTNNTQSLPINYTIYADVGLHNDDVANHDSDMETRIMPLQWGVDRASSLPLVSIR